MSFRTVDLFSGLKYPRSRKNSLRSRKGGGGFRIRKVGGKAQLGVGYSQGIFLGRSNNW